MNRDVPFRRLAAPLRDEGRTNALGIYTAETRQLMKKGEIAARRVSVGPITSMINVVVTITRWMAIKSRWRRLECSKSVKNSIHS